MVIWQWSFQYNHNRNERHILITFIFVKYPSKYPSNTKICISSPFVISDTFRINILGSAHKIHSHKPIILYVIFSVIILEQNWQQSQWPCTNPYAHILCSKISLLLTTYPPLCVYVICESSLMKTPYKKFTIKPDRN